MMRTQACKGIGVVGWGEPYPARRLTVVTDWRRAFLAVTQGEKVFTNLQCDL